MKIQSLNRNHHFHSRSGVTLAETAVAIAIFGISIISLFAGFSSGFSTIKSAREDLRATQIMLEKMETLRLYTWDQVTTPNFMPTVFTNYYYEAGNNSGNVGVSYFGNVTITNGPAGLSYSTNLLQVTIELSWSSGGMIHTREMSSLVARDGLQDYIY